MPATAEPTPPTAPPELVSEDAMFRRLTEAVASERGRRGLSARAAAGQIGVAPSTVTRIGAGRTCSTRSLLKMLLWLDVPLRDFLTDGPDAEGGQPGDPGPLGHISALRRAAARMLELADTAVPGPWTVYEDESQWSLHHPPRQILKAPKRGTDYAEYWPDLPTGEHIASWHPQAARAVGLLLQSVAREYEAMLRSAPYVQASDREAAERLRRGPAGLGFAVGAACAFLGEADPAIDGPQVLPV